MYAMRKFLPMILGIQFQPKTMTVYEYLLDQAWMEHAVSSGQGWD
jgi:hypothetical protein